MSALARQLALPQGLSEPYTYHDIQRPGFVSVLVQGVDGKRRQRSFKLDLLPRQLEKLDPERDTWISQGEFFKPNRRIVNLWRMALAYVDLDTYHVSELASRGPEFQLTRLLQYCDDIGLPQPSIVVYSGRGLQVKWLFAQPVPKSALPRWQALQNELCSRLQPLGADHRARDASRVLRLVDTINTRSSQRARVLHQATTVGSGGVMLSGGLVGYDFDELMNTVMPMSRTELATAIQERQALRAQWAAEKATREARKALLTVVPGRKAGAGNLRTFVPSELAWARLADLRKLAELRGWAQEGAPAGQRDMMLFLAACFVAQAVVVPRLRDEVDELAREFTPNWSSSEVQSCVSSVLARAGAAAKGQQVEFNGHTVDPRYRWRNATLIDRLGITAEEERQMGTIVSQAESKRRDAQRKEQARAKAREEGEALSREGWLASHEQKRATARLLRAQGKTWPEVATMAGYQSANTARMACK